MRTRITRPDKWLSGIPRKFGLSGKIIFPSILLFLIFSATLAIWISKLTGDSLLNQAQERTDFQYIVARKMLDVEWTNFAGMVQSPQLNTRLSPMVERGMVGMLREEMRGLNKTIGADFVNAYDLNGNLLGSSVEVPFYGHPAFLDSIAKELIHGDEGNYFLAILPEGVLNFMAVTQFEPKGPAGEGLAVMAAAHVHDDFGDVIGLLLACRLINGNQGMVQSAATITGGALAILQNDLRIASSLTDSQGNNLIETTLDPDVAREVLTGSGEFAGRLVIGDSAYSTRYGRLKDRKGQTVGILEITTPISGFLAQASHIRNLILLSGIAALVVFTAFMIVIINRSIGAVHTILKYMNNVSVGHLGHTIEVKTRDELATLADGINETVHKLKDLIGNVGGSFGMVEQVSTNLVETAESLKSGAELEENAVRKLDSATSSLSEVIEQVVADMEAMKKVALNNTSSLAEVSYSVDETARGADELASSSADTSTAITQSSTATDQIASSVSSLSALLEETSTSMIEVDKAIKQINDLTGRTKGEANELAIEASKKGHVAMESAKGSVEEIKALMSKLGETVKKAGKRSEEIGEIVDLISDISEETNLLALNASILAAQAGEKGRGFTVVANEIRELSNRTSKSVKDIEKHINSIQQDSKQAVKEMDLGIEVVAKGVDEVSKVEKVLEKIITGATKTRDFTEKIAEQTVSQAKNSSAVADALKEISLKSLELSSAANQQGETARHIMKTANEMGERSVKIKEATGEQSKTVKLIAKEVEGTVATTDGLSNVAMDAKTGVTTVVEAAEVIHKVLEENRQRVASLMESVNLLSTQAEQVRSQISIFDLE